MGVQPLLTLTAVCLFLSVSGEQKADCIYKGKIYKDGEMVTKNCQICECDNGEIKDCSFNIACTVAPEHVTDTHINYDDDPHVFGSSDTISNAHILKKRSIRMENVMKVPAKDNNKVSHEVDVKGGLGLGNANLNLGGGLGLGNANVNLEGGLGLGKAKLDLGGALGHHNAHAEVSSGEERKLINIDGGVSVNGNEKHKFDVNGGLGLGNANLNLGGGLGLGNANVNLEGGLGLGKAKLDLGGALGHHNAHAEVSSGEERKLINIDGGVSVNGNEKHKVDVNGGLGLGNANLNLGGGLGLGNANVNLEGGLGLGKAKLDLGGALGHHNAHAEVSSGEERKLINIDGGVSVNGNEKHEVDVKGGLGLGNANLNLGGGLGLGNANVNLEGGLGLGKAKLDLRGALGHHNAHAEVSSGEERKLINIDGGVSVNGNEKHEVDVNGGLGLGNANLNLGGGLGLGNANVNLEGGLGLGKAKLDLRGALGHHNAHAEVSSGEERKLINIDGGVSVNGNEKHKVDVNGGLGLGNANLNLGGGLGLGNANVNLEGGLGLGKAKLDLRGALGHHNAHAEVSSSDERKLINIDGGVSVNGNEKHLIDVKGGLGLENGNLNLGGGLGLGNANVNLGGNLGLGNSNLHVKGGIGHENLQGAISSSGEDQKIINIDGGSSVNKEIVEAIEKHLIDVKGGLGVGNANVNLGGILGHQKGQHVASSHEERKVIINGNMQSGHKESSEEDKNDSGEGTKRVIDVKGGLGLGNVNLNLGGILGHQNGHRVVSSHEEKNVIINGKMRGEHKDSSEEDKIDTGEDEIDINGGLGLGNSNLNHGGGLGLRKAKLNLRGGLGHHNVQADVSSSEERKLINIDGGVSLNGNAEANEKHLIDVKGSLGLGNANVNLGGDLGLGHSNLHVKGGIGHQNWQGAVSSNGEDQKLINIDGGASFNKGIVEAIEKHLIDVKGGLGVGHASANLGGILGHQKGQHDVSSHKEKKVIINGNIRSGHKESSEEDKNESGEGRNGIIDVKGGLGLGNVNLNLGGILGHQDGHRVVSSHEEKNVIINGKVRAEHKESSEEDKKDSGEEGKSVIDVKGGLGLGNVNLNLGGILGHQKGHRVVSSHEEKNVIINGKVRAEHKESSEEDKKDSGEEGKSVIDVKGGLGLGNVNLNLGGILGHQKGHRVVSSHEEKNVIINGKVRAEHKESSEEDKKDSGEEGKSVIDVKGGLGLGNVNLNLGGILGHQKGHRVVSSHEEKNVIINGKVRAEHKESSEEDKKDSGEEGKSVIDVKGGLGLGNVYLNLGGILGHQKGHRVVSSHEEKNVIINGKVRAEHKESSEEDKKDSGEEGKSVIDVKGGLGLGNVNLNLGGILGHQKGHRVVSSHEEKNVIINGKVRAEHKESSEEDKKDSGEEGKSLIDVKGGLGLGNVDLNLGGILGHQKGHRVVSSHEEKNVIINGKVRAEHKESSEEDKKDSGEEGKSVIDVKGGLGLGNVDLNIGGILGHQKGHRVVSSHEEKNVIINGKVRAEHKESSEEDKKDSGEEGKSVIDVKGGLGLGNVNLNLGGILGHQKGHRVVSSHEEKNVIINGKVRAEHKESSEEDKKDSGEEGKSVIDVKGGLGLGNVDLNLGGILGHQKGHRVVSSHEEKNVIINGKVRAEHKESSEEDKKDSGEEGKSVIDVKGGLGLGNVNLNLGGILGHQNGHRVVSSHEEKNVIINGKVRGDHKESSEEDKKDSGEGGNGGILGHQNGHRVVSSHEEKNVIINGKVRGDHKESSGEDKKDSGEGGMEHIHDHKNGQQVVISHEKKSKIVKGRLQGDLKESSEEDDDSNEEGNGIHVNGKFEVGKIIGHHKAHGDFDSSSSAEIKVIKGHLNQGHKNEEESSEEREVNTKENIKISKEDEDNSKAGLHMKGNIKLKNIKGAISRIKSKIVKINGKVRKGQQKESSEEDTSDLNGEQQEEDSDKEISVENKETNIPEVEEEPITKSVYIPLVHPEEETVVAQESRQEESSNTNTEESNVENNINTNIDEENSQVNEGAITEAPVEVNAKPLIGEEESENTKTVETNVENNSNTNIDEENSQVNEGSIIEAPVEVDAKPLIGEEEESSNTNTEESNVENNINTNTDEEKIQVNGGTITEAPVEVDAKPLIGEEESENTKTVETNVENNSNTNIDEENSQVNEGAIIEAPVEVDAKPLIGEEEESSNTNTEESNVENNINTNTDEEKIQVNGGTITEAPVEVDAKPLIGEEESENTKTVETNVENNSNTNIDEENSQVNEGAIIEAPVEVDAKPLIGEEEESSNTNTEESNVENNINTNTDEENNQVNEGTITEAPVEVDAKPLIGEEESENTKTVETNVENNSNTNIDEENSQVNEGAIIEAPVEVDAKPLIVEEKESSNTNTEESNVENNINTNTDEENSQVNEGTITEAPVEVDAKPLIGEESENTKNVETNGENNSNTNIDENSQINEAPITEAPVEVDAEPAIAGPVEALGSENLPAEGESCIFNKDSVLHGQSVQLTCVTCNCNNGALTCIKDLSCQGICSVTGHQMIRTFDGSLYESPGTCSYMLVKTSIFSITLNNKPCAENPDATCIDSVDIYIPSKASIKLLSDGTILSAGVKTLLPFNIQETVTVLRSSSVFLDVVSLFFTLQYDFKANRIYIILDSSFKDHTDGLCGTYNDNRNDDYRSSNDMTETVSGLFSKSWKVQEQCSEHDKKSYDESKLVVSDLSCSGAFGDSIFEDCRSIIDIHSYKSSCINSVYFGDTAGFCSSIADYAYRCARAGIFVSISSTFTDCALTCEGDMVLNTDDTFTQQDCAEYSSTLNKVPAIIPLNEACICPPNLYYDASLDKCVEGDQCPCYINNQVYKIGETIIQQNGETCPCERILQCDSIEEPELPEVDECSEDEVFSDCFTGNGKACEPSCHNLEMISGICPADCKPGCVCKYGFLRDNNGKCVPLNECPCVHGDNFYNPGETLAKDCNTCTCENGKFVCTTNACNAVCNTYAGSQFILFDKVWKTFPTRDCPIVLVESQEHVTPSFKVIMENVHTAAFGGALVTKKITITFGGTTVTLSDSEPIVSHSLGIHNEVKISNSGFYVIAEFSAGLSVYYDQHLDVIIQLQPQLQGKVEGMCGDADGKTTNEMTISNMGQYAAQFLTAECPAPETPITPSDLHKQYIDVRCSLLKSDDFAECHNEVSVEPYYTACIEETANCKEGESCLCFCTALAAYARACCRKGITVEWRNPDTCPSPCEYYNRESGEGPYRLVMLNGKILTADYDTRTVSLGEKDIPGLLKASFMVTRSLFKDPLNGRKLISLESAQHPNFFIVQEDDGILYLRKWQPNVDFRKRATFIVRKNRWVKGFDALESFTLRGSYLSFSNNLNAVLMSKVKSGSMLEMSFKLSEEAFGLPSFSVCTWKYRACNDPCIPTCQDPLATKCTLNLKIEGCFPICAPGMVFDEITHRCVQHADCVTIEELPTTAIPAQPTTIPSFVPPTKSGCENVKCETKICRPNEHQVLLPNPSDPCCPLYKCETIPTTPSTVTEDKCKNVHCQEPPKCLKKGAIHEEVTWPDPCCSHYTCTCKESCAPPPSCDDGRPPVRSYDSEYQCCPEYTCVAETTTQATTTIKEEPCKDVDCPVITCEERGYVVVATIGDDPCCPEYLCVPETSTVPPPIATTQSPCDNSVCHPNKCGPEDKVIVKPDPNDLCCPLYECESPPTTTTTPSPTTVDICRNIECEVLTRCYKEGATRVQVSWPDPCCPHYICECQDACALPPTCSDGSPPIRSFDPEYQCCAEYTCVVETTTVPSGTPKQELCKDVDCPVITCDERGYVVVATIGDDPCCPEYTCEPQFTTVPPNILITKSPCDNSVCRPNECGPEDKVIVKPDPNDLCCPLYECESPPTTTTIPSTTTVDICRNVECEVLTRCDKQGATRVQVYWSDPCCPHYICECQDACAAPPTCSDGSPPIRSFDPEYQCCAEYTCVLETTTVPSNTPKEDPCKVVDCSVLTCEERGYVVVATIGDDPCCPEYTCVPDGTFTTVPPVVSTESPCENVKCTSERSCLPTDTVIVATNPENPCCPLYICEPQITTPITIPKTTTPTTPVDICKVVDCPTMTCTQKGSSLVGVKGQDPCCFEYSCECIEPCGPPLICKSGARPIISIDIEMECCPTYKCPDESKLPTVPPSITTLPTPEITTTQPTCKHVFCIRNKYCADGEITLERPNPLDPCCPLYECVAISTPKYTTPGTPSIVTSSKPDCSRVICNTKKTCKQNERLVTKLNPLNPCCPLYECECNCKTVPACGSDERLVAIHQKDQCCPKLKCERKRDECNPVPKLVSLSSGKCSASVILSVCSGYCHSSTEYSSLLEPVSQCRCCSVTTTQPKNFELPCLDGTRLRLTAQEAVQCGCNKCSGSDYDGSGDESEEHSGEGSGSAWEGSGSAWEGSGESSGHQLWSNFEHFTE
ncbi:uncharacterized protein LOC128638663 isoform X5 [Bombina bombina]|uniref:uncharacterized protein LOC128638663 isoform X5 n=1 Tax=Bombina bombina TaxID=8345 RepID=UPI00235AC85F|nr:uncharacterized protein LOC128638663 isoform X5 [Bombina bombina]